MANNERRADYPTNTLIIVVSLSRRINSIINSLLRSVKSLLSTHGFEFVDANAS